MIPGLPFVELTAVKMISGSRRAQALQSHNTSNVRAPDKAQDPRAERDAIRKTGIKALKISLDHILLEAFARNLSLRSIAPCTVAGEGRMSHLQVGEC